MCKGTYSLCTGYHSVTVSFIYKKKSSSENLAKVIIFRIILASYNNALF